LPVIVKGGNLFALFKAFYWGMPFQWLHTSMLH